MPLGGRPPRLPSAPCRIRRRPPARWPEGLCDSKRGVAERLGAEVEQAGVSPTNLASGIGLSPDKMLMGRIFSCHDIHLHRIGPTYEQLPINAPKVEVHSYN